MALHFAQREIDEFKECFNLYSQKGLLTAGGLRFIMRSLGFSPTVAESEVYFKKGTKIDFASFLDILYEHSQHENSSKEVLTALQLHDPKKLGCISAAEMKSVLTGIGEKLTPQEVDAIFKEANIPLSGSLKYEDFVKVVSSPLPDYY